MTFFEALNIRHNERLPVSLLIFQSIFLGTFIGAFDVGANTLFLNAFDESMIPKAIVISGFTGIILTSIYSYFQNRLVFSKLAYLNLLVVFVLTFLLRAGYFFSDTKWLAFALFVLMGPLNIVALVGFWGTVSRIFDLRQGKRLFGIIDTGQVIGVILSSWAVPLLITKGFKSIDLLYISAVSVFIAVIIQIIIGYVYPKQLKGKVEVSQKKSRFSDTLKIPYVRTMSMFVIFSMLVAFFIHYLFLAVADSRFEDSGELAKFLGGLMGTLTFVSILIKTFVYGPVMKNYGLKVSLLISPVVMALMTVAAAMVGGFFGFTVESASFTFFFLLISLGKLFQKALKDSIESPSLKMIYQSLNPSIRYEVQARVDGTINETAALASGILLTILSLISFITMIHFVYFLIAIIVIWFFITFKLYTGYRKTLESTLEKSAKKEIKSDYELFLEQPVAGKRFLDKILLIEYSKPWLLGGFIKKSIKTISSEEMNFVLDKIEFYSFNEILPELKTLNKNNYTDDVWQKIQGIVDLFSGLNDQVKDSEVVLKLLVSKNFEDRIISAKLLGVTHDQDLKQNLTFLLRDLVPAVKIQSIIASRGTRQKEIISFLIDYLEKDKYAPLAHASLIGSGETGLEMLDQAYYRTAVSDVFRARILKIIPETGGIGADESLFNKLDVQSDLNHIVVLGLQKLEFQPNEKQLALIHQKIIEQAGVSAWNLNVYNQCPSEKKLPFLKTELNNEYYKGLNYLFELLKLLYNKSSIETVKENLEAGTGQSITFAVELLDTFMDEDLKPYVFPLLEDVNISSKLWALESYFPLRTYDTIALLKAIINRDNNLIGRKAKIYCLNAFDFLEKPVLSEDIIAQMFSSDMMLSQLSSNIIEGLDKTFFLQCKRRLADKQRVKLDKQLEVFQETGQTVVDRLNFLQEFFKEHSESKSILFLLYQAQVIRSDDEDLFELESFYSKENLFFIKEGRVKLIKGEKEIKEYKKGDSINTRELGKDEYKLKISGKTLLHCIDSEKLLNSIYDNEYLIGFVKDYYTCD